MTAEQIDSQPMQLVKYEAARRALAEAVAFDEVMSILNVAEQAALYARQANDNDLVEKATEIRVRAQRKAGEMLAVSKARGERADGDGTINQHNRASHADTPTLADIGVSPMQSSRWQSLASMSDEHFETAVETAKATAGEVTTAFMLREAAKHKPAKKTTQADKRRLVEIKAAQARGVSMLTTYARLTLTALRGQSSFTRDERVLLGELREVLEQVSELQG